VAGCLTSFSQNREATPEQPTRAVAGRGWLPSYISHLYETCSTHLDFICRPRHLLRQRNLDGGRPIFSVVTSQLGTLARARQPQAAHERAPLAVRRPRVRLVWRVLEAIAEARLRRAEIELRYHRQLYKDVFLGVRRHERLEWRAQVMAPDPQDLVRQAGREFAIRLGLHSRRSKVVTAARGCVFFAFWRALPIGSLRSRPRPRGQLQTRSSVFIAPPTLLKPGEKRLRAPAPAAPRTRHNRSREQRAHGCDEQESRSDL
jgi:hypothetical protein